MMTKPNENKISLKSEIKGKLVEQFLVVKEYFGLENNAEVIRALIKEKARNIQKAQLTPSLNINEQLDTLFYQGYFEEFLEELSEKEPELFNEYTKQQSKPSEKGEVKS